MSFELDVSLLETQQVPCAIQSKKTKTHSGSKDLLQAVQMCNFKRRQALKRQFEIRAQGISVSRKDLFSGPEEKKNIWVGGY